MSSSRHGESSNKKNKGKEKASARKRIVWFIGRPKKGGEMYEQMVRDAARATGLGVWYIRYIAYYVVQTGAVALLPAPANTSRDRSHAHGTTSLGGADVRDDEHMTIFADREPGGSADADFEFEGHIYLALDEDGTPWRLLHPEEFEFDGARAPIVLYDAGQNSYPYYLGHEYYQYYESLAYEQYYPPHQEAGNVGSYTGVQQSATGEGEPVSHVKTKRKRARKGKGKAT